MREKGYTSQALSGAGLAVEKEGRFYDRFRGRLMFPIMDTCGNVIGFGGRAIDNSNPKYINTLQTLIFNKRDHLFALNLARKSKADEIILVEEYLDAITLYQHGFDNAAASLGTSLTEEQTDVLSRHAKRVILIYDSDEAGQKAVSRAIPMLEKAGLEVRVLQMKETKDPDEFLRKFGAEQFGNLLKKAPNRVEYQLEAICEKYDTKKDEQ